MSRVPALVAVAVLLAAPARAQDGLRSASLPERPIASTPDPGTRDVFIAGPQTYTPRRDRAGRDLPPVFPVLGGGYLADGLRDVAPREITVNVRMLPAPPPAAAPTPAAPAPPPPVLAPGKPKTFYVIPGCYAGDKHPRDTPLAAGCDRSKLRVLPPG